MTVPRQFLKYRGFSVLLNSIPVMFSACICTALPGINLDYFCLGIQTTMSIVLELCQSGLIRSTLFATHPTVSPHINRLLQGHPRAFREGEVKFASISGFQGEVLVEILDFPIYSIHFHFSLSSREGEVSQLRETFSPKSPSRMTPAVK